ncbi:MAG: hypothetical protein E7Z88_08855 [Cyanobacteria bacterium SIG27]|nr:hypothetical protein [Cyanobacteria bacterium SIG27]
MDIKVALLKNIKTAVMVDCTIFSQDIILNSAANALKNGAKIIQFYSKNATDKQNLETALKLRQLCSIFNALLIINSRVDIAQIVQADGVCLFEDDISFVNAKKILDENKIIAQHITTLENALSAIDNNVNYICINSNLNSSLKGKLEALNKIKIIELNRQ